MLGKKALTISIAAYNVGKYLPQALDSIVKSPELSAIDTIVVNDGSSDGTIHIVNDYVRRYPESVRLINKENGGYGTTVNKGIEEAQGEFFKILDGDDWFDTRALTHLVRYLKECEADLVVMPRALSYDDTTSQVQPIELKAMTGDVLHLEEVKDLFGHWNLVARTSLVRKCCKPLPEHMLYTDSLYTTYLFAGADIVSWFDEAVYCYRLGRDGQSVSIESRIRHADENAVVASEICRFIENEANHIHNKEYVIRKATTYYIHAVLTYTLGPASQAALRHIVNLEKQGQREWPHIYEQAAKTSRRIHAMRATGYWAYWILKIIGIKNWE